MGDRSQIQWTDATWNPVTGCSKVSTGCKFCYAERVAIRLWPSQYPPILSIEPNRYGTLIKTQRPREFTDVQCHEDRLDQPLRWKKPRKVFVNSMSDLFHEDVPDAFIDRVFVVMALAPQHTFQVLTKRAERMRDYCRTLGRHHEVDRVSLAAKAWRPDGPGFTWTLGDSGWFLPNVWLGVSCENQHFADARIPLLLQTPAAVRFISAEPLLGPLLLDNGESSWLSCRSTLTNEQYEAMRANEQADHCCCLSWDLHGDHFHGIDWVIAGGESQKGARPSRLAWYRSLRDQCRAAGVAFFLKQLGARPQVLAGGEDILYASMIDYVEDTVTLGEPATLRLRDSHGGDIDEFPEDLRVREFPSAEGRS